MRGLFEASQRTVLNVQGAEATITGRWDGLDSWNRNQETTFVNQELLELQSTRSASSRSKSMSAWPAARKKHPFDSLSAAQRRMSRAVHVLLASEAGRTKMTMDSMRFSIFHLRSDWLFHLLFKPRATFPHNRRRQQNLTDFTLQIKFQRSFEFASILQNAVPAGQPEGGNNS